MSVALGPADWLAFLAHFGLLSLLAVGGAIATVPDMHRYLVDERGWLSDAQFNASVAIGQASPGPNVLFVALFGWNVGLNSGGLPLAFMGAFLALVGTLVPSTTLTYFAARWGHQNSELRGVRAFKQGMAPMVVALLISTGWILATGNSYSARDWPVWAIAVTSAMIVWRTRIHLLWLLGAGAFIGWMGWL